MLKFNKKYRASYLNHIFILLFAPAFADADEFDWKLPGTSVSEVKLYTESGTVLITMGSNCKGGSDYCDVAAKFSSTKRNDIEFLRETANGKGVISILENGIVITLLYYPIGVETGLQITKYYEWNKKNEMLELKNTAEKKIEI